MYVPSTTHNQRKRCAGVVETRIVHQVWIGEEDGMTIPLILEYVVARLSGYDKEVTRRVSRGASCLSDSPFDFLRQAASD